MTKTTARPTATAIKLAMLIALGSTPIFAQTGEIAEFLQEFPRQFDRRDLATDIEFSTEDGSLRAGVRCATRAVGDFERTLVDSAIGEHNSSRGRSHRLFDVKVPIVFHVVQDRNRVGRAKKKHIKRQVRVLNRAYAGRGFQFEIQAIRRHTDGEFAAGCLDPAVERRFKSRHAVDPAHTLNVYTCLPSDGVLGYAYPPWNFTEDSFMHGVVLRYSTLPKGSAAPFNKGDTLTHEVGHYLGLLHTFEGACSDGDQVLDTPAEQGPAYGCPLRRNTCSAPGPDPVRNFMNYSDDSCMNQFSPGQVDRMRDLVAVFRSSL